MRFVTKWLAVLAAIAGVTAVAAPAHAQASRTWVSGVGDDANPCSRTAPCKTFAGAISKTASGGEINCLDAGGYGAVTVTKSITIDCTSVMSSILSSATNGVIVIGAGIHVRLRGLTINGAPPNATGLNGVRFLQGASLSIEDCVIFGFNSAVPDGYGVAVVPSTANDMRLYITNTTIANNGAATTGGGLGIIPVTAASTIRATLSNVRFLNNSNAGIYVNTGSAVAGTSVAVSVEGTRIAGNGGVGIAAAAGANGPVNLLVTGSTITNNTTGIVTSGATLSGRVGSSTISTNTTGLLVVGGATLSSFGNNELSGNGSNGSFSGTVPLQ